MPSLADLSRAVLGRVLRGEAAPHDCADDARAAMALVQHLLQKGTPCAALDPPRNKVGAVPLPPSVPARTQPAAELTLRLHAYSDGFYAETGGGLRRAKKSRLPVSGAAFAWRMLEGAMLCQAWRGEDMGSGVARTRMSSMYSLAWI